ncbi:MAG: serine/threonine protein kinase [Xanthobacteraceae bacterium]|nr:MAG: serine/threonine protein kinase [Xanthobacteraceae bacterium]
MAKPRLQPGTTLDGFLIGGLIYKGGMSRLWRVTRPDIGFPLLMKVPILHEGEDPAAIVGFEMEQMILPRLTGPHVPRFVAAGDFTEQPYIVMEHVGGESLLARLPELPLPSMEVAAIGAKVATALDHLHRQHVIHLDIKPSNILFRATGEAVLIDYGLARHDQLPDLMDEEFRLPYGTAPYMAPEQVLGTRSDPRSDLFALGVLLYFFTTGVRPFGDPQRMSGLKRRIWRDPAPPRQLRPDYPPWLQEIVLRCLEVNPAQRYPTAAQVAFDLQNPEQVRLTERSEKLEQDSYFSALRRRLSGDAGRPRKRAIASHIAGAPIVAVALDLGEETDSIADAMRTTVVRILEATPDARLACLNVLRQNRVTIDRTLDEEGHNKHVNRLVRLKSWADPLRLTEGKVTYHVLEAVEPAAAILEYARANHVDHIVMGARANSTLRKLLGSVSGEVAAQAPCTVTVVRKRGYDAVAT